MSCLQHLSLAMDTCTSKPDPAPKQPLPAVVVQGHDDFFSVHVTNPASKLPFWGLVSFGAYLLFKLGYGVFTFNDVPEAHAELMKEIDLAREDLKTKGVEVD